MGRPRIIAESTDPELRALLEWAHARLNGSAVTYAQLAADVYRNRSWMSRALSGRRLPPPELIEALASRCGAPVQDARRMWQIADAARRQQVTRASDGYPPLGINDYISFRQALADMITARGLSQRELVRRDHSGVLRRSTVGAVLRGERSLSFEVLIALVATCGLADGPTRAWQTAWHRYTEPFREQMERRRREIAFSLAAASGRLGRGGGLDGEGTPRPADSPKRPQAERCCTPSSAPWPCRSSPRYSPHPPHLALMTFL